MASHQTHLDWARADDARWGGASPAARAFCDPVGLAGPHAKAQCTHGLDAGNEGSGSGDGGESALAALLALLLVFGTPFILAWLSR